MICYSCFLVKALENLLLQHFNLLHFDLRQLLFVLLVIFDELPNEINLNDNN